MPPAPFSLAGWETFYVIMGSAAAVLIGLQFVVITLSAGRRASTPADETTYSAFASPTVIHFGVVLLLASWMTIPRQSVFSIHLGVVAAAAFGLVYVVRAVVLVRRQRDYKPVASDWWWHIALPLVAYAHLLFSGFAIAHAADSGLFGVAVTTIALTYIGIRNAWDSAIYIATQQ